MVFKYLTLPTRLTTTLNIVTNEQSGYSATNIPIDDLKSAVSTSIPWNAIDPTQANPPYDPNVNPQFIPWFQVHDPTVPQAPGSHFVCLLYL